MNKVEKPPASIRIMEVCGTHTQVVAKSGLRDLLPKKVQLLSGPGCPVCVTDASYIDMAIDLLRQENVILATFGDMLHVPGHFGSLSKQSAKKRIVTVYSPTQAVQLAIEKPDRAIVFLAVGFETTAPLIAVTAEMAYKKRIQNLYFLTALKRMEPALRLLLEDKQNRIDGLICPGHVATILGANAFAFITEEYHLPAVICGFQASNIQAGIDELVAQITGRKPLSFQNFYPSCVSPHGNQLALQYLHATFSCSDTYWRGMGNIRHSAFVLKEPYQYLDARIHFDLAENRFASSVTSCICGEIIRGNKTPDACPQFGVSCTPQNPIGPCMVSTEGACSNHYKYGRFDFAGYH